MRYVFWTAGILFLIFGGLAIINFLIYGASGEPVPKQRAARFYRFAVLVALTTLNIVTFKSAVETAIAIWGH